MRRRVPFLSSESTWLAEAHISKGATLQNELKDILVDLSGCDVALRIYMLTGPHEPLGLLELKELTSFVRFMPKYLVDQS
jgi:hypothetical protein